jgi:hypothetical protein
MVGHLTGLLVNQTLKPAACILILNHRCSPSDWRDTFRELTVDTRYFLLNLGPYFVSYDPDMYTQTYDPITPFVTIDDILT